VGGQQSFFGSSPFGILEDVVHNNNTNDKLNSAHSSKPLCQHTEDALDQYFTSLNGNRPGNLYDLVLGEVERPLFKAVMDYTHGNQSQAAGILGINRGTLRKKLKTYSLLR
jgi:Fis family transcriptional regulator